MRVGSFLTRKYSKWKQVWCEDDCWRVLDKMSAVCWEGGEWEAKYKKSCAIRIWKMYILFVCVWFVHISACDECKRSPGGGGLN